MLVVAALVFNQSVKMAACSGGVEWTTIIKPILAASYGSFNKSDITNFVKGIIKRYNNNFFTPKCFIYCKIYV
jgi:hypothetical protein